MLKSGGMPLQGGQVQTIGGKQTIVINKGGGQTIRTASGQQVIMMTTAGGVRSMVSAQGQYSTAGAGQTMYATQGAGGGVKMIVVSSGQLSGTSGSRPVMVSIPNQHGGVKTVNVVAKPGGGSQIISSGSGGQILTLPPGQTGIGGTQTMMIG